VDVTYCVIKTFLQKKKKLGKESQHSSVSVTRTCPRPFNYIFQEHTFDLFFSLGLCVCVCACVFVSKLCSQHLHWR